MSLSDLFPITASHPHRVEVPTRHLDEFRDWRAGCNYDVEIIDCGWSVFLVDCSDFRAAVELRLRMDGDITRTTDEDRKKPSMWLGI